MTILNENTPTPLLWVSNPEGSAGFDAKAIMNLIEDDKAAARKKGKHLQDTMDRFAMQHHDIPDFCEIYQAMMVLRDVMNTVKS